MNRPARFILLIFLLLTAHGAADPAPAPSRPSTPQAFGAATQPARVRFVPVDVLIDPRGKALACYEVEIVATRGDVKLLGIEGGESDAFNKAPFYDPRALAGGERIILGAYTLGSNLPTNITRVARLMLRVGGDIEPDYRVTLRVAASNDEMRIPATVTLRTSIPLHAGANGSPFSGRVENQDGRSRTALHDIDSKSISFTGGAQ